MNTDTLHQPLEKLAVWLFGHVNLDFGLGSLCRACWILVFSAGLKPAALKLLGPASTQTTAGLFLQTGFCYGNFCLNKAESQRARTNFFVFWVSRVAIWWVTTKKAGSYSFIFILLSLNFCSVKLFWLRVCDWKLQMTGALLQNYYFILFFFYPEVNNKYDWKG